MILAGGFCFVTSLTTSLAQTSADMPALSNPSRLQNRRAIELAVSYMSETRRQLSTGTLWPISSYPIAFSTSALAGSYIEPSGSLGRFDCTAWMILVLTIAVRRSTTLMLKG